MREGTGIRVLGEAEVTMSAAAVRGINGIAGRCYVNAVALLQQAPAYISEVANWWYVEGWALAPRGPRPIAHAWCMAPTGFLCDPTPPHALGTIYVPALLLTLDEVAEAVAAGGALPVAPHLAPAALQVAHKRLAANHLW